MATIALVACAKQKLDRPAPAEILYASPLFRVAIAYAKRKAHCVFILSAKYWLLEPQTVIAPYDASLNYFGARLRRQWANIVALQLATVVRPGDTVLFLAGQAYREPLAGILQREYRVSIEVPLVGLSIGEQLQWLRQRTSPRRPTLRERRS